MAGKPKGPSHRRILKPKPDWLPLARAVFVLRAKAGPGSKSQFPLELGQLRNGKESGPSSLEQLAELLKETSGATTVKIDPRGGTFTFTFCATRRGAACYGGTPWDLLGDINESASGPRHDAEAMFAKAGFVGMSESDASNEAHRLKAIREATGLVWRQFLLRDFDHAVATGEAVLLARVRSLRDEFEPLSTDACSQDL